MLKLIDKMTIIIISCMIVTFTIMVIVSLTQLIDAYIIADEKLSTETTRTYIIIDCETEMIEGDIRHLSELYDPFGNWRAISLENVSYQLKHGGRLVKCK